MERATASEPVSTDPRMIRALDMYIVCYEIKRFKLKRRLSAVENEVAGETRRLG